MRNRTEICVECDVNRPAKGRVCDKCRGQKRKDYHKQRYQDHKPQFNNYQSEYRAERVRQAETKRIPLSRYSRQYQDRQHALQHYGLQCQDCGWNKVPEVLQVHHIDCNRANHKMDNLAILCPTCHSIRHYTDQTGSWTPKKSRRKSS